MVCDDRAQRIALRREEAGIHRAKSARVRGRRGRIAEPRARAIRLIDDD